MNVTRITEENIDYFSPLIPEAVYEDKELLHLGAVTDEGEACAVMSVSFTGNMAVIEWIYTAGSMREQGAGTALVDLLRTMTDQLGLEGIEVDFDDEADELDFFLKDYGFLVGEDNDVYEVPIKDIVYGDLISQLVEAENYSRGIRKITDISLKDSLAEYAGSIGIDRDGLSELSDKYSFVVTDDEGGINCSILISEEGEDDLRIHYLDAGGAAHMAGALICEVYVAIMENEHTEGKFLFTDRDGQSIELVEKLTREEREKYRVPGLWRGVLLL
ncbi:MAG: hypothetical protein IJ058_07280 [Lachnospiraceae bacterium]|nr:hypothetical protein [Lachnospiraceae bacterium]